METKVFIRTAALSFLMWIGCAAQALPSESASISGALSYAEDVSLPSNAIAYITLTDVSPLQHSSSEIIARQIIHVTRQNPMTFELEYDPARINEHHLYAIQVQIAAAGKVVVANSSAYPVITQGHPTMIEVHIEQID